MASAAFAFGAYIFKDAPNVFARKNPDVINLTAANLTTQIFRVSSVLTIAAGFGMLGMGIYVLAAT